MTYILAVQIIEQQGCPEGFLQPHLAQMITRDGMKGRSPSATPSALQQMFNQGKISLRIANCEPPVYCLMKGYCSHVGPGPLLLVFSVNVWVFRAV